MSEKYTSTIERAQAALKNLSNMSDEERGMIHEKILNEARERYESGVAHFSVIGGAQDVVAEVLRNEHYRFGEVLGTIEKSGMGEVVYLRSKTFENGASKSDVDSATAVNEYVKFSA